MSGTASSTEAPGHRGLQSNEFTASFIDFFPGRDTTLSPISWAKHFAVQPQTTRQPAWYRVAVEAHSTSRRTGLIMKRISLPRFRALGESLPTAAAPAKPLEQEDEEDEEAARRIRPRLSTFIPTIADVSMPGKAPSQAEIMSSLMKAKAAVANHYYTHISTISAEENQQSRENRYIKWVPRKRLLGDDDDSSTERDALTNRNRLRTYAELANILARASESGAAEIDLSVASSAEASAALLQSGRDPRVHLAAQGVPDLSVIADATEVAESPSALPKLPGAISPIKRLAGQSSPIRTPTKRLTDSLVPLLPGSSPKASPSPTKSSTPSTPLKTSPQAKRLASSPAGFPRSPVTMQSPAQQPAQQRESPGTPTFSSPRGSKNATPSSLRSRRASSIRETPTKQRLRPATTPSRRNTLDLSSPYQMFSPRAATPSETGSPLGFVASLPDQYKAVASSAPQVVVGDVSDISFGPNSPSFTHASWLKPPVNAGEIQRSKNVSNALRRRSEPLARSLHKAKIRKRSMSPQKSVLEGGESPAKDFSDSTMTFAEDISNNSIVADVVPAAAAAATAATTTTTDAVTTPISTPKKVRGIVDVDMRKSLDIFAHKASPRINGKPAMEELARIAGSRCDGGANVMVFQENGRLVVRFKLPTEYATMFPESQGADESQFSSSPDVSDSPPLRMKNSPEAAETPIESQSPANMPCSSPALHSSPCKGDRTFPVSDFNMSSPVMNATHSPSFALRSSAKRTAALRAFALSPATARSPFADSSCISFPDAIIDNDDTTIPGMRSPTQLGWTDPAEQLKEFSSPSKPKATPLEDENDAAMDVEETSTTQGDDGTPSPEAGNGAVPAPPTDEDAEKKNLARSKRARFSSPSGAQKQTAGDPTQAKADTDVASSKPADESPGREYMRDFIKRSKPKASGTPTTASTAAKPRHPLEAKSPNAESVQRPKRKLDEEDFESEKDEDDPAAKSKASSVGKNTEAMPPKEKQSADLAALTTTTQDAFDEEVDKEAENDDEPHGEENEVEADPDADELGADFATGPATRRSSRLRGISSTAAKSSIPTPVRVGRGKAALSSIRNEQQDLTRQTLANTRRNKGKALSAKRALAKLSKEEKQQQQQQQEDQGEKASESSGAAKGGKSVVWKEPLAAYGESKGETQADEGLKEKPRRGRGASKATTTTTTTTTTGHRGGAGRVTKPASKAAGGPQKGRAAKAAVPKRGQAGTPARMTRSRARD